MLLVKFEDNYFCHNKKLRTFYYFFGGILRVTTEKSRQTIVVVFLFGWFDRNDSLVEMGMAKTAGPVKS